MLELINEYLGDGVDSDDEDIMLTPQEQKDFHDHHDNESDVHNENNADQDNDKKEEIELMDIDSNDEENFLVIE